ncbi:hypothetical protein [Krasilnikovia sp. MM14-A1259]|uniref:hypothetical protein n=1 Tax=Krasilnikovia sp. MM14-A1259 TaxID=3373539 RepID=UPI0037FEC826
MVIKPEAIPQFTGNVAAIEQHAGALTGVGGQFRDIGADVHSTWQGLSAFYEAPEADQLFAATAPIKTTGDSFGGQVEKVGSALSQYAAAVRPIADRLASLKTDATGFANSVAGDDDWREDEDKVNHNNDLIRQVDAQVAALMAAERAAANQINALYGGTQWTVDDGSGKPNAYGFNAADVPGDADRPWGSSEEVDEPWYVDTWNAVWSGTKGVVVDGLWGTVTGLWGMINVFDWDTFKSSWTGIWTLTGGVFFDPGKTGNAWKELGKSFIAWDEWEKDPARATGLVLFNVLTLPFAWSKVGKAGFAGKAASAVSKVGDVTKISKIAELADAGKLAGLLKLGKIELPTVADLAKQVDGVFKDAFKRDPDLDAALRHADDLTTHADTAALRGDDIVSHAHEPAHVRQPELVGAGGHHGNDFSHAGRAGNDIGGGGHGLDGGGHHGDGPSSHHTSDTGSTGGSGHAADNQSSGGGHHGHNAEPPARYRESDLTPSGIRDKQYGLELYRDADGNLHFPGDREGTIRDANGDLHENGHYASNDNPLLNGRGFDTHGAPDLASRRTYTPDGDSPADTAVRDAVADRNQIVAAREQLWDKHLGPIADKLKQHSISIDRTLSEARVIKLNNEAAAHLSRGELLRLEKYGNEFAELGTKLNRASEHLGEAGGNLAVAREFPEYRTISAGDGARGTSNNLDRTLFSADHNSFIAIEEKGVGSPLGGRRVENPADLSAPKIKSQQMSPEYLRHMLQNDNKLGPVLRANPQLRSAIQDVINGTTPGRLRYIHVHTSATGQVKVTDYIIDSGRLGRDSIRVVGSE